MKNLGSRKISELRLLETQLEQRHDTLRSHQDEQFVGKKIADVLTGAGDILMIISGSGLKAGSLALGALNFTVKLGYETPKWFVGHAYDLTSKEIEQSIDDMYELSLEIEYQELKIDANGPNSIYRGKTATERLHTRFIDKLIRDDVADSIEKIIEEYDAKEVYDYVDPNKNELTT